MGKTISLEQFLGDPMQVFREVQAGERYTISEPGELEADIVMCRAPRWIPAEEVNNLRREFGPDGDWAAVIAAHRASSDMTDPWKSVK